MNGSRHDDQLILRKLIMITVFSTTTSRNDNKGNKRNNSCNEFLLFRASLSKSRCSWVFDCCMRNPANELDLPEMISSMMSR